MHFRSWEYRVYLSTAGHGRSLRSVHRLGPRDSGTTGALEHFSGVERAVPDGWSHSRRPNRLVERGLMARARPAREQPCGVTGVLPAISYRRHSHAESRGSAPARADPHPASVTYGCRYGPHVRVRLDLAPSPRPPARRSSARATQQRGISPRVTFIRLRRRQPPKRERNGPARAQRPSRGRRRGRASQRQQLEP